MHPRPASWIDPVMRLLAWAEIAAGIVVLAFVVSTIVQNESSLAIVATLFFAPLVLLVAMGVGVLRRRPWAYRLHVAGFPLAGFGYALLFAKVVGLARSWRTFVFAAALVLVVEGLFLLPAVRAWFAPNEDAEPGS